MGSEASDLKLYGDIAKGLSSFAGILSGVGAAIGLAALVGPLLATGS